MPDLLYEKDGLKVLVEVKQLVDAEYLELSKALSRRRYTHDARLTKLWTVSLDWTGSVRRARAEVVEFLMTLEAAGVVSGTRDALFNVDQAFYDTAKRLRIAMVSSIKPTEKHPAGYYLLPSGWGGIAPTTAQLPEFVEKTLGSDGMQKLRSQLRRSLIPADQRHAFLIIGPTDLAHVPLTSDADGRLPAAIPSLPEPVDGVWLVSERSDAHCFVATTGRVVGDGGSMEADIGFEPGATPECGCFIL